MPSSMSNLRPSGIALFDMISSPDESLLTKSRCHNSVRTDNSASQKNGTVPDD